MALTNIYTKIGMQNKIPKPIYIIITLYVTQKVGSKSIPLKPPLIF